jgi:hypothetical protein
LEPLTLIVLRYRIDEMWTYVVQAKRINCTLHTP